MKRWMIMTAALNASIILAENMPDQIARNKIDNLKSLITVAEKRGIDIQKEKMTVRVAEVFLEYADWDEAHVEENTAYFKQVGLYKNNAAEMAETLPDFERNDIIKMLNESEAYLKKLIDGTVVRKPSPRIDWAEVLHEGDQLTYKNRPVFLADYTWKPETPRLMEYFGQQDGFYISPTHLLDKDGNIAPNILHQLRGKPDGRLGFIFINNNAVPRWATDVYGKEFTQYEGAPFHAYDIDHPGARKMMSALLAGTVPQMAGKKYTELGYMLCNEPRWITYRDGKKKVWYNGGVSEFTMNKFRSWLKQKHGSINRLNHLWASDFSGFSEVKLDIPIDIAMVGTPRWYDWNAFNDERVTDWYRFMKKELRRYDPAAKAHLKIMPSFFSNNDPCTGIDLEALTELSDIIGNDCAAEYNNLRETPDWKERYSFGWRELYMSYDFLKSVSPDQIIFNTESHFLSTGYSRDLYMDPAYPRAVTWAAHTLGLNASQIWFWPRREDGSIRRNVGNGYAGSNNQQPRVTQAIHSTMIDLNAHSEAITAMQRQRKPLRIFYSKTSAIQNLDYMDEIFDLYEALNFEGLSLGFATENIIRRQDRSNWDAVLLYKTNRITENEHSILQEYLNGGGCIITDRAGGLENEYGEPLAPLKQGKGILLTVDSLPAMKAAALTLLESRNLMPEVELVETNGNTVPGCTWKCIKNNAGNYVVSIVNLGNTDAALDLRLKNGSRRFICRNLLDGTALKTVPLMHPYDILFIEIQPILSADPLTD
ncbi:hypothetical protein EGM51_05055 [Verrucomicrobia bacterium S94]|nr:hypothetical protein EGM51_05055 [Verrucomicrobia bacterium S94]